MDIQSKFDTGDTKTNVRPTTLGVMQGWGRMSAEKDGHWAFFDSRDWEPVDEWMTIQVRKDDWKSIDKFKALDGQNMRFRCRDHTKKDYLVHYKEV